MLTDSLSLLVLWLCSFSSLVLNLFNFTELVTNDVLNFFIVVVFGAAVRGDNVFSSQFGIGSGFEVRICAWQVSSYSGPVTVATTCTTPEFGAVRINQVVHKVLGIEASSFGICQSFVILHLGGAVITIAVLKECVNLCLINFTPIRHMFI